MGNAGAAPQSVQAPGAWTVYNSENVIISKDSVNHASIVQAEAAKVSAGPVVTTIQVVPVTDRVAPSAIASGTVSPTKLTKAGILLSPGGGGGAGGPAVLPSPASGGAYIYGNATNSGNAPNI